MGAHYATRCLKKVVAEWGLGGGGHQKELMEQRNLKKIIFKKSWSNTWQSVVGRGRGMWFTTPAVTSNKWRSQSSNDENALLERGCGGSWVGRGRA